MTIFQAVLLGIVQGLTEFLPISSSAHLRLVPELLGWQDPGAAFTAVIQWGTFVASVIYFRRDIARITVAFFADMKKGKPWDSQDSQLAWMIIVGSIPIVVFGLLLQKHIKLTFRSLYVVASSMILLALLLTMAEWISAKRRRKGYQEKDLERVTWKDAMLIGFAQALALVPGASRSGVTITGALFAGLNRPTAARFSFLLSLPSVFGAGLHQMIKERDNLLQTMDSAGTVAIATLVSGLVGYGSIAFLLHYLRTKTTAIFICYRILLGLLLLFALNKGIMSSLPPG